MSILAADGWGGIRKVLSNWHVPHTCVFDLCLGFVWRLSDKWRSQGDRIYLSDRWCYCCRLQGLRAWCIRLCVCMCLCVWESQSKFVSLYLSIRKLLTLGFFFFLVWESRRESAFIRFMHVLEYYIVSNNAQVCVYMCGYLLSGEPRGAKRGRMTLMRCVGMCPRVVLVWLSFCCFSYSSPLRRTPHYSNNALQSSINK